MTKDEWGDPDLKSQRKYYDEKVHTDLGDLLNIKDLENNPELDDIETYMYDKYEDDDGDNQPAIIDIDDADIDTHDRYVGSEVELQTGDQVKSRKIKRCVVKPLREMVRLTPFWTLVRTMLNFQMYK